MKWFADASHMRRLHFWAAIAWQVFGVPLAWYISYQMDSRDAQFAILLVSNYANTATHWGAYQATRAEEAAS